MYPGEFETLFRKIANNFTLETVAERREPEEGTAYPKHNPQTPLWDTIDTALNCDYIDIGDGRYVSCKRLLRKPIRILFFILLTEFEGRLFRIQEWQGKPISELNENNLNDFIRELVNSDLINLQKQYATRADFNEDLKAVSAFRNVIVHVNKKLEQSVKLETLVARKNQMLTILSALQEIMDGMKH